MPGGAVRKHGRIARRKAAFILRGPGGIGIDQAGPIPPGEDLADQGILPLPPQQFLQGAGGIKRGQALGNSCGEVLDRTLDVVGDGLRLVRGRDDPGAFNPVLLQEQPAIEGHPGQQGRHDQQTHEQDGPVSLHVRPYQLDCWLRSW